MSRWLIVAVSLLSLTACEKAMRNMYDQPKYTPASPSPLFPDNQADRPPVPGTIPRSVGALASTSSGRFGSDEIADQLEADRATTNPYPTTAKLLRRGKERFEIFCAPCHSPVGDGDGIVVRRGFPHPPSYHTERLRHAPDRHFYDVMTDGYGIMYSYADRVSPQDRWAIIAYIRALQHDQAVRAENNK